MLWVCILLMSIALVVLVYYVIEKIKGYTIKSVLIKTLVSIFFVAVAAYSSYVESGHVINHFILLGLLFGLTGDIWLDLKYVYPKDDKIYSYAGFFVFGVGHVLFITGMYLEYFHDASFLYILIPLIGAVIVGFITQFMAKPMKLDYKEMKWPVFAYSLTLFSLPLCALSLLILNGWAFTSLIMLFVGGILFAASDLILSGTYFGEGHEKPLDFILNYSTYYSAQFIIAFSIFFL